MDHPPKKSTGCVYVAFDTSKQGRCKIGYSSREAKARISEASNPDYKLFGQVKSPQAKAVERITHSILEIAGIRRLPHTSGGRSEWFLFSAEEALRVVTCAANVALIVPLKPLLPELCKALVLGGITEHEFLMAQCRVVIAVRRRKRTLYRVMQIEGRGAWERYGLRVWLDSRGEKPKRKELANLLQKYRAYVPVQNRKEWHEHQEFLPANSVLCQKTGEDDLLRVKNSAEAERIWNTITLARDVLAVSKDKRLEDSIARLVLLLANNGPLDTSVQQFAETTRNWIQTCFKDVLSGFEERKQLALEETAKRAGEEVRHALIVQLRKENAELTEDLKPWVEITGKRLGVPNNLAWDHCPLDFTYALEVLDKKLQSVETSEERVRQIIDFTTQWRTAESHTPASGKENALETNDWLHESNWWQSIL